ncbi:MAG: spore germination protein, partial [Turicibacter sp.]
MNEAGSHEPQAPKLNKELKKNIQAIQETLGNPSDLMIREFKCHNNNNISCAVIGIDGLVDSNQAEDFIIKIMMVDMPLLDGQRDSKQEETTFNLLYQFRLSMIDTKIGQNFDDLYSNLLSGHIIVLVDGEQQLLMMDCKGYMIRSTGEPTTDNSIRGPKDCFVENLRTNTAMLRKRIKDKRLRFDSYIVGEVTQTDVAIVYIDGIVNPEFVKTAKERIQNVKIDGICDSSQLLMLIEDKFTTFFPRLLSNERPDKITAELLEGRVAIIVDGSPFVIIGPASFNMLFQAVDDYYSRPVIASFQRLIRYLAFIIVILTPALYIALSTYHQEMIPTVLLLTIINQRSANPFPTLIETLIIV